MHCDARTGSSQCCAAVFPVVAIFRKAQTIVLGLAEAAALERLVEVGRTEELVTGPKLQGEVSFESRLLSQRGVEEVARCLAESLASSIQSS
jgi:hypothetical protein